MTTNEIEEIGKSLIEIIIGEAGYGKVYWSDKKKYKFMLTLTQSLLAYGEKCREEERERIIKYIKETVGKMGIDEPMGEYPVSDHLKFDTWNKIKSKITRVLIQGM